MFLIFNVYLLLWGSDSYDIRQLTAVSDLKNQLISDPAILSAHRNNHKKAIECL